MRDNFIRLQNENTVKDSSIKGNIATDLNCLSHLSCQYSNQFSKKPSKLYLQVQKKIRLVLRHVNGNLKHRIRLRPTFARCLIKLTQARHNKIYESFPATVTWHQFRYDLPEKGKHFQSLKPIREIHHPLLIHDQP